MESHLPPLSQTQNASPPSSKTRYPMVNKTLDIVMPVMPLRV